MNIHHIRHKVLKPIKSWRNKYLKYRTQRKARRDKLYELALQELSEYTGEPIEVIRQKHKAGPPQEKEDYGIFCRQESLTKDAVEHFYRQYSFYIYELSLWNAQINRPEYLLRVIKPYLRQKKYRRLMDFGAGTGDLSMALAQQGYTVTYCDIGKNNYTFAQWRFKRRSLDIAMVNGLDVLAKKERFDCIISLDVFEHIKDLSDTLEKLINHIKSGGSLIFSGAFSGGGLHIDENNRYNDFKTMDRLLRKHGMAFQDRFAQFFFYIKH